MNTRVLFTNHSQEHSMAFSPRFCKFECNTTEVVLHSHVARFLDIHMYVENKTKRIRHRTFFRILESLGKTGLGCVFIKFFQENYFLFLSLIL